MRYERVSRRNLPRNVTITRTKQTGQRNKRTRKAEKGGSMLGQIAKWGAKLGAKTLFKKGASKIKNKSMKKALESDVGDYIVKETQKKVKEDINNLFG